MSVNPLSTEELDALIGDRAIQGFLNFRSESYRSRGYKENPPTREEAIREMAKEPNLIRRPILKRGEEIHVGADLDSIPWLDLSEGAKSGE
jgi:arsenate reductase-like glutaredoxin family protein